MLYILIIRAKNRNVVTVKVFSIISKCTFEQHFSLHDVYYIFKLQNKDENRRKLDSSQSNISLLHIIYNVNELYLMSRPDQMLTACLKQGQPLQVSSNKYSLLHTQNSSYSIQHSSTLDKITI